LKEYFGIDIQIKVVDFEFEIPSVQLDLFILSQIFFYKFSKENLKITFQIQLQVKYYHILNKIFLNGFEMRFS